MRFTIPQFIRSAVCCCLLLSAGAQAAQSPLFGARNPDAPEGVEQYGQLVGKWVCAPASRQEDGSMKASDARPTWIWHYALNGHAIQDVWIPDPEKSPPEAAMGTNLRVYDADADRWEMVWTAETLAGFLRFTATMRNDDIVMRGEIRTGPRPPHLARVTFHNIGDDHFDWRYEASGPDDGETWQLQATLACDRVPTGTETESAR